MKTNLNIKGSNIRKHPKCLGDGIDDCGYDSKINCDDCKYNSWVKGRKDPEAKCNRFEYEFKKRNGIG